jgi:5,10-methylenetetrahydromethanopterin reductase
VSSVGVRTLRATGRPLQTTALRSRDQIRELPKGASGDGDVAPPGAVEDDPVGMEVWLHAFAIPGRVAELARWAEQSGFTGLLIADSQNLTADIWVELALAGAGTSSLRLGPGVTNPFTRHITVTASAAATLQAETGGRAILGFARGDSALSLIGLRHVPVAEFEQQLRILQGLLRGEDVTLENGTRSAIRWLADGERPKVPVHVAATGARTIQAAARHAEGVDLTLGAELERLRDGVALARRAAPASLSMGAYLNVAVDDDRERARSIVRGSVATFARFPATHTTAHLSEVTRHGVAQATAGYEKDRHGEASATFAQQLENEFIDRFAIAGPPEEVRTRLEAIRALGIERLIIVPGSLDTAPELVRQSIEPFARDVLPALVA